LPRFVFEHESGVIDLITASDVNAISDIIFEIWDSASASTISIALESAGYERPTDIYESRVFSSELRPQFGLGDEHIVSVTMTTGDELFYTSTAVIIELLDTERAMLSTFIAIVYTESEGLQFFTLERTVDWFDTGTPLHMFCFVTLESRGSFFAVEESNRAEFIGAIDAVIMADALQNLLGEGFAVTVN